jgi:hypothetical protein
MLIALVLAVAILNNAYWLVWTVLGAIGCVLGVIIFLVNRMDSLGDDGPPKPDAVPGVPDAAPLRKAPSLKGFWDEARPRNCDKACSEKPLRSVRDTHNRVRFAAVPLSGDARPHESARWIYIRDEVRKCLNWVAKMLIAEGQGVAFWP